MDPDIDIENFELRYTHRKIEGDTFKKLLRKVLKELNLYSKLEYIEVNGSDEDRAQLYRERENQWPSPKVELDIDIDRYLNKQLLMHEFAHEADRWDENFKYNDQIDKKFAPLKGNQKDEKYKEYNAYNLAWNISIDSRRSPKCLSKEYRFKEYKDYFEPKNYKDYPKVGDDWFEELWANPPKTHCEIVGLANKFIGIINQK